MTVKRKLVLFDCDGVLVNSEELIHEAQHAAFAQFGLDYTHQEIRTIYGGLSYEDHLAKRAEEFRTRTGREIPAEFAGSIDAHYDRLEAEKLRAIEGVVDLLTCFNHVAQPCGVASNGRISGLDRKLGRVGLLPFFNGNIFSREHVARGKPAPDVYLHAAKTMGFDPADCIVIDDTPLGVQAGVAAGMHTFGFARLDQPLPADPRELLAAGAHETVTSMAAFKARIFDIIGKPAP